MRSAESAYSNRVCGKAPRQATYTTGQFDFMSVVNAASLPRNNTLEEHRKAWASFRQLFNEEWREHEIRAIS
jgi:hypothetical protein